MWKLAFILLVAMAIWKFYPNIMQTFSPTNVNQVEQTTEKTVKSEKTIYGVTSGRERMNREAQAAMDRY